MKTNDLKKGDRVILRNGWRATIMDNRKANIRFCEVDGSERETIGQWGGVYAHDIVVLVTRSGKSLFYIKHTPSQLRLRNAVESKNMMRLHYD